ncbi:hypothetical protein HanOQP8_Chr01g0021831 [Helianthus annuus]|nr:hypothetical protein HanOQP8_Chr01g0021831 [Helianthus annuus]
MTTIQMSKSYGAIYPQEGDTVADAPAGMVTMFAEFFSTYNLRLPLMVSMVDLLEYYKTHISQLSPLGMVCARHFEYCFRSQNLESLVEYFRQFYQMHVQLWFYLFYLQNKAPKIMPVPPKGFTSWKTKFFYVKEAAITCKLHFRNVTRDISKEKISLLAVENRTGLIICKPSL